MVLARLARVHGPYHRILSDGDKAQLVKRVLIIGGYGNFGGSIARALASDPNIALVIGGRTREKAAAFAAELAPRTRRRVAPWISTRTLPPACAISARTS